MKAARPDLNIELLGINAEWEAAFNYLVPATNTLPWLQDTTAQSVWGRWNVVYRDVRILDSQNQVRAVYNLTDHNLDLADNRAVLKQLLLDAAKTADTDHNGLPDDWELQYFGALGADRVGDPDQDGESNFTEFAFATDPLSPSSRTPLKLAVRRSDGEDQLAVTFRRRAGAALNYVVEFSSDLVQWSATSPDLLRTQGPRTLFDGTGAAEMIYTLRLGVQPRGFLRVRAAPR